MNPSLDHLNDEEKVTYFGETDARNRRLRFGIKRKDRAKHLYAIGKTGMGKSTLLENLAVQDILNGEGLCFLDPHGKSADLLLEYVPEHRIKDVIYFAPFDMEHPVSFNVMEDVGPEQRYLVASGMMSAFKKIWVDAWSARMEYILGNIMLALLEYPGSTLVGVNRMLTDKDFRKEVVNHISDPSVKSFWVNEYANYTDKFAAEAAPAIQNKVGQFIANPLIRNIIGQPKSSFDIRDVMDNRKILIINLSKGRVGEANANLLGSMLITKIYLGAMSRADLSEKELAKAPDFYLYVDEFQSFANESFADILSEARKYKLSLNIAHQYIEQMTEEVRAAVFGNVGTMVTFRVGAYDAEVLEKEFSPYFMADDIVALQKYQMYLKLMIDGVTSPPFSASGMSPIPRPEINYTNDILASSRSLYARPRQQVEDELLAWIQKKFGGGGGGGSNPNPSSEGASSSRGSFSADGRTQGRATFGNRSGNSSGRSQEALRGGSQGGSDSFSTARSNPNSNNTNSNIPRRNDGGQLQPRNTQNQSGGPMSPRPSGSDQHRSLNQNSSQSSQPNRRQHVSSVSQNTSSKNSVSVQRDEREQKLRNAMSLSYLKAEPVVSKQEKVPKPENIAALREALLSVMKTEGMTPTESTPSSSISSVSSSSTEVSSEVFNSNMISSPIAPPPIAEFRPKQTTHENSRQVNNQRHTPTENASENRGTAHHIQQNAQKDIHRKDDVVSNINKGHTATTHNQHTYTKEVDESELKNLFAE